MSFKTTSANGFVALAKAVMKEDALKAERGELSLRYVRCQLQRMEGVLFAAFGDRDITEIDYAAMDELRTELFRRGLSNSTIRLHFASLNKVIAYAQRVGVIASPPINAYSTPFGHAFHADSATDSRGIRPGGRSEATLVLGGY